MSNSQLLTASDLYTQFKNAHSNFESGVWRVVVFEGSPEEGLYSWCPDCNVALPHIQKFEGKHKDVKLLRFKVGSRLEWESKDHLDPFRENFPFISDVPTAILFRGKVDVFRLIAPDEADLAHMRERIEKYDRQIANGSWHPPSH